MLLSQHILHQELAGAKGKNQRGFNIPDNVKLPKQTKLNESYMKVPDEI